jgi:hypothetical protein
LYEDICVSRSKGGLAVALARIAVRHDGWQV